MAKGQANTVLKRLAKGWPLIALCALLVWIIGEQIREEDPPPQHTVEDIQDKTDRYQRAITWFDRAEKKHEAGDMDAAFPLYERAANEGDSEILEILINRHLQASDGFPYDIETAERYIRRLDTKKRGPYLTKIAQRYQNGGRGIDQDIPRAAALIDEAIASNYDPAFMIAYSFYADKRHPAPYFDPDKALRYIDVAIAGTSSVAPRMTKAHFLLRQDDEASKLEAVALLEAVIASEARNPKALRWLGDYYYENGQFKEAARYYHRLETPLPETVFRKAEMLRAGARTKGDWREAREHYAVAATARYIPAMLMMGHIHRLGLSAKADPEVALSYYAAINYPIGHPAGHFIGAMYQDGALGSVDYAKAKAAYKDGMEAGMPAAYVMMARLYEHGHGVPKDPVKAFELMNEAGILGSNLGRAGMADYYERGIGTEPNLDTAKIWNNKIRSVDTAPPNGIPLFDCDICDPKTD
ncbi:hypothetical protein [Fretibacter rubidus]|uniref:SEL1-like repeat protein n=1 Tax=Fretibacter rubidus TaxID=570162 RepID=UPI00352B0F71